MSLAPSHRASNSRAGLSDSRVSFLHSVHSAWDLIIRIYKDLRTRNQDDSIQFSPFQIRVELK